MNAAIASGSRVRRCPATAIRNAARFCSVSSWSSRAQRVRSCSVAIRRWLARSACTDTAVATAVAGARGQGLEHPLVVGGELGAVLESIEGDQNPVALAAEQHRYDQPGLGLEAEAPGATVSRSVSGSVGPRGARSGSRSAALATLPLGSSALPTTWAGRLPAGPPRPFRCRSRARSSPSWRQPARALALQRARAPRRGSSRRRRHGLIGQSHRARPPRAAARPLRLDLGKASGVVQCDAGEFASASRARSSSAENGSPLVLSVRYRLPYGAPATTRGTPRKVVIGGCPAGKP